MFQVGVIGLKGHENVVFAGMRTLGDFQIVAVADDDQRAVNRLIGREPLARGAQPYQDWRHLVEHHMLDVAVVCDENHLRLEQLTALAERNIHIVTEKPLTTTLEDLETLKGRLERSKSQLTMLLTMRHEAHNALLKKLVSQGAIGQPMQASAQKSYRWRTRPEWQKSRARLGGTIPYIGIHALDSIRWASGLEVLRVAAFHGNADKKIYGESESHASVLCELSQGASATTRLDYLRPDAAATHGDDRLRIVGTEGVIETDSLSKKVRLIRASEALVELAPEPVPNLFVAYWQALQAGEPLPISAADSLRITEVVLAAREAADTGRLLELGPPPAES